MLDYDSIKDRAQSVIYLLKHNSHDRQMMINHPETQNELSGPRRQSQLRVLTRKSGLPLSYDDNALEETRLLLINMLDIALSGKECDLSLLDLSENVEQKTVVIFHICTYTELITHSTCEYIRCDHVCQRGSYRCCFESECRFSDYDYVRIFYDILALYEEIHAYGELKIELNEFVGSDWFINCPVEHKQCKLSELERYTEYMPDDVEF